MRNRRDGKITAGATMLVVALAMASMVSTATAEDDAADLARGEELFGFCAKCHDADGGGNSEALAPAIAGMPAWYVEGQLKKFKDGLRGLHAMDTGGLRMYPMSNWLRSEDDQRAVATYVASLPATTPARELAHEGDATKGKGYYAVCSACHMPDGSGNQGMGAPPLVGMSDWYLFDAIKKYKGSVRGSTPGDSLGPAMIGMVATLPNDDAILDVIAHIQSLEK